jgi:MOSC domain-containing protein YiiM
MNVSNREPASGRVASLHLHPSEPGAPLAGVASIEVIVEKGIAGNGRYFGRVRSNGNPSRRQVTLIEREQIDEHAATLGLETIPAGAVRSNIETSGLKLASLLGRRVAIGTAVLHFYELRDPCNKMDAICQGLRELMLDGKQGVLAEVVQSGRISVGDKIEAVDLSG